MNLQGIRQEIAEEIKQLRSVYQALGGVTTNGQARPRRKMSKAARAKIAAAQKKRWAKAKGTNRRVMSASARRKISLAQKARWKRAKAA